MNSEVLFMRRAIAQARRAAEKGEVPVGAVLVSDNKVLSVGHNSSIHRSDPTAHAEIVALRKAGKKRSNYRLEDCELYVTLEPCAMCLGAMVQSRIRRLVYGASDPKAGAVASIMTFPFEKTNHRLDIKSGVLAEECSRILKEFFRARRSPKG